MRKDLQLHLTLASISTNVTLVDPKLLVVEPAFACIFGEGGFCVTTSRLHGVGTARN